MIRIAHKLARDERGTSVVEMGLAAPILALFLIGTIDLSRGYSAKLEVEQAAQSTLETVQQQGYNHSTTSNPTSLQALENEAKARAGTGSTATAAAYLECWNGGTKTTQSFTSGCPSGQTSARYVSISVSKTYTPLFSYKFAGANADGTYTLTANAAIRVQ